MGKPETDSNKDGERTTRGGDPGPRPETAKKPYLKPVLAKHDQLHGVGLGSP